jgi:iron complex transport system substrate-binding protein
MMVRLARLAVVVAVVCISTTAAMQRRFVDDAGRSVTLPSRVTRVFAAGAPAEVMLYTLVPDLLVGRNRVPSGDALEFFPPAYRNPTLIRQLPEVDNPAADAELLALKPDVYVDYGTVADDYVASVEAVQRRTGVPGIILSGALSRIPEMYRRLGDALGQSSRGQRLGAAAERLLTKYRGGLGAAGAPVRVYLACSADGYVPCLDDDSAGEQLQWLGGTNVAGTRATAPRRPLTIDEIAAMAPHVIVVTGSAAKLRADPAWQKIPAVAGGRVYQWPALPYSWGPRPPSVNRLPGVAWLAYVARGRGFDAEFHADIRDFFADFYHLALTDAQIKVLLGRSSN